jgi:hypothetical protein
VSKGRERVTQYAGLVVSHQIESCDPDGDWDEEVALRKSGDKLADAIAADLDEIETLRADLLATRRALKMAQRKAMGMHMRLWFRRSVSQQWASRWNVRQCDRAQRLCDHYAAKFEREAGEM